MEAELVRLVNLGAVSLKKLPPGQRLLPAHRQAVSAGSGATGPLSPMRGDIFAYTMLAPRSPNRRRVKKMAVSASALPAADAVPEYIDPFTDWKKSVMDKNKMSLTQLRVQSFEGMSDLANEIKHRNIIFKKVDLKALDALGDDRLHDNRMLFSTSGMLATEIGRKHQAESKRRSASDDNGSSERKLQAQHELFEHYNVNPSKGSDSPTLKDFAKLLRTSYEVFNPPKPKKAERRRTGWSAGGQSSMALPTGATIPPQEDLTSAAGPLALPAHRKLR